MAKMADKQKLAKALEEIKATPLQWKMAGMLLSINGLNNALGFIEKIKLKEPEQLSMFNG